MEIRDHIDKYIDHEKDYKVIDELSDNVFLVKSRIDGQFYVKKDLDVYSFEIYEYLKNHHINNTPVIYDIFTAGNDLIVIEQFISGKTLYDYVLKNGVLSESESVAIMKPLCSIVRELHGCKPPIIHRDIKPENIIVKSDGSVVLLDMNAAKFYSDKQTKDTYLLGTYGYAAPEQYGFGKANKASDIYGLGKVLNFMLTGDVNKPVYGAIGDIIGKCTEIDYTNRYQNVDELLKALRTRLSIFTGLSRVKKVILSLFFVFFTMIFMTMESEEITNVVAVWVMRIVYYITFMSTILYALNFADVWKKTGIDRIRNYFLRIVVAALISVGILVIGIIIGANLVNWIQNGWR